LPQELIRFFDSLTHPPSKGDKPVALGGRHLMATYNNLPVYKTAYDLLLEIFQTTKNFSREYKYTIGQDLKLEATQLIKRIFQANSAFDTRRQYIQYAREHTEVIRLYSRLLKDLKQVNIKKFISINEKIESISKQLAKWMEKS
jgi:hypothetical protein